MGFSFVHQSAAQTKEMMPYLLDWNQVQLWSLYLTSLVIDLKASICNLSLLSQCLNTSDAAESHGQCCIPHFKATGTFVLSVVFYRLQSVAPADSIHVQSDPDP